MCSSCKGGGPLILISWVLVLIGGLNWGLHGLGQLIGANLNVVDLVFMSWAPAIASIIYLLVGIAALILIFTGKSCKKQTEAREDKQESAQKQDFSAETKQPETGGMSDMGGQQ